ncbi:MULTISPECIES: hypothetical protein [unclassified Methylobacterium]|uniref:hypothetical protein n=1 Tax=unclassified Methylobacterium TaxID=2615210 RepID=UPI001FEF09C7|nr:MULTISPECIES: hypothetical protein [unclassified Methylobacterium]
MPERRPRQAGILSAGRRQQRDFGSLRRSSVAYGAGHVQRVPLDAGHRLRQEATIDPKRFSRRHAADKLQLRIDLKFIDVATMNKGSSEYLAWRTSLSQAGAAFSIAETRFAQSRRYY